MSICFDLTITIPDSYLDYRKIVHKSKRKKKK